MSRDVLVVSPVPSHGIAQGSSVRVRAFCEALRARGFAVWFVYYALDGDGPAIVEAMRAAWDRVFVARPLQLPKRGPDEPAYGLDEWCGPELLEAVEALLARRRFDLMAVNYVWLSKTLTLAGRDCPGFIDTHDVFGGRAETARAAGLEPNWYWTTPEAEAEGLRRADAVVAIQPEEARTLEHRAAPTPVHVVGHLAGPDYRDAPPRGGDAPLTALYTGSANPWNVASMKRFAAALRARGGEANARLRVAAAGPVGGALADERDVLDLPGLADDLGAAMEAADIVINPTAAGTGLKIKTIDALRHGRPVAGLEGAFAGLVTDAPEHRCVDEAALVDTLLRLADDPARLAKLSQMSRDIFADYARAQQNALDRLLEALEP